MPGFQTKPLTITIVSGNDFRNMSQKYVPMSFAKPKDRVPTDQETHAVYSIPCGDCEKVYLGQTKRQFCTRLKEHQRAVSNFNSSKSALAEHVCETSHNIVWEDSKVITTNNRYGQRLCLEAWHINTSPCALNRDDGSHLPQEYLHLVGK